MRTTAAFASLLAATAPLVSAHAGHHHHAQRDFTAEELKLLEEKWGTDWAFTGISTFGEFLRALRSVAP